MTDNPWCNVLGIATPRLDLVKDHREANVYALLLVALLEKGLPMTLVEVAAHFEAAGIADAASALAALKRCKPGRPPVYRDGDRYHLDPHNDELDLWAFRLGLRPPKVPRLQVVRPAPEPPSSPDAPLSLDDLRAAWNDASLYSWSSVRVVLAILDANRGPMLPHDVVDFVAKQTKWHLLQPDSAKFGHRGCPIEVLRDGRWVIAAEADQALLSARKAVRARLDVVNRNAANRPDPVVLKANFMAVERKRAAHAAELARMSRALLAAFPIGHPRAVALLDVGLRTIETFVDEEIANLRERLLAYDIIAAVDVRALLRAIGFDPGERRLGELRPPQKSKQINRSGRALSITTELLVQGTCGISQPFGDEAKLSGYLQTGQLGKLRHRLEADAKSLFALYQYGRLHGVVRLRWGFLDDSIPAPWVYRDEIELYRLKEQALKRGIPLEAVLGHAPGWTDPWTRVQTLRVMKDGWQLLLADEDGYHVPDLNVQLARLALPHSSHES
jgi:hypothetical protein